jgi:hypothetical protein
MLISDEPDMEVVGQAADGHEAEVTALAASGLVRPGDD